MCLPQQTPTRAGGVEPGEAAWCAGACHQVLPHHAAAAAAAVVADLCPTTPVVYW